MGLLHCSQQASGSFLQALWDGGVRGDWVCVPCSLFTCRVTLGMLADASELSLFICEKDKFPLRPGGAGVVNVLAPCWARGVSRFSPLPLGEPSRRVRVRKMLGQRWQPRLIRRHLCC